jgi:hypothetical protein
MVIDWGISSEVLGVAGALLAGGTVFYNMRFPKHIGGAMWCVWLSCALIVLGYQWR